MGRISTFFEGGLRRAGALVLTSGAVVLLSAGLGLILYGLGQRIDHDDWQEPLSIGVPVFAVGAAAWFCARRLAASARQAHARRMENRILRLARERFGRLTVIEAAVEAGLTAAEAESILRGLAEGGFVEIEVNDAGVMSYRFPEVIYPPPGGGSCSRPLASG